MRHLAVLIAIVLVAVAPALATPTCVGGTYADLMSLTGGCVINNLLFDNFGFSNSASPSGIAIPASGVGVSLITTPGNEGFTFNPGMSVTNQAGATSSFQDVRLTFHVSVVSGSGITDLHLGFDGNYSGTGTTNVNEQYCSGPCPGGAIGAIIVTNPPTKYNDSVVFAPVNELWISKDMNVTSGTAGTAYLSLISNQYSHDPGVPEPMSLILLGSGLVGIGWLRRKHRI